MAEMGQAFRALPIIGLSDRDEVIQVDTLLYSIGNKANDILQSFKLSKADQKNSKVKGKFNQHFCQTSYSNTQSLTWEKEEGELVDSFIIDMYALAEHDKMICDRLVVGLQSVQLFEKLQTLTSP